MRSVAILGNIASGKSELARSLADALGWHLVEEPVAEWQKSGFLAAYYADIKEAKERGEPAKIAGFFQCYALMTRLNSYRNAQQEHRVYDSHIVTDLAFVRSQLKQGIVTQDHARWYVDIWNGMKKLTEQSDADLYIYLDAEPSVCLERILQVRARDEETDITIEYLRMLRDEFEVTVRELGDRVVRVDASKSAEEVLEIARCLVLDAQ